MNTKNGFVNTIQLTVTINMTDPMMTVREFLTLPRNDANTFLNLWANRQPNPSLALTRAQGLRLKAALAVADGTEQDHPPENQRHYGEDKADYDHGDLGPRDTHDEEYSEFPGLAAFIKQCGEPCKMVMESDVTATPKMDSFSPKKEGAAV